jgi:hypothetical protein
MKGQHNNTSLACAYRWTAALNSYSYYRKFAVIKRAAAMCSIILTEAYQRKSKRIFVCLGQPMLYPA